MGVYRAPECQATLRGAYACRHLASMGENLLG